MPISVDTVHVSVQREAILRWLEPQNEGLYLDATLGGGGHTAALLDASAPSGRVVAIDADPLAAARVSAALGDDILSGRLTILTGNFRAMGTLCASFAPFDGIVMDLGLSSDQLADRERGFAFSVEAPLDMRFNPAEGQSAADLLNTSSESTIADILYTLGEERHSRAIARRIAATRATHPLATTTDLVRIITAVIHGRPGGIHPATRSFQALRIAVNGELDALQSALSQTPDLLKPGGRIAVISFHSLEDRIVKHWMREEARTCVCPPRMPVCTCQHQSRMRILTPHPELPTDVEIARNTRARSAKLRVAERL